MTNYSGFYRYDIGDVVEVLGFTNRLLLVFRHRRGGLLSSTKERQLNFMLIKALQQELLALEDFVSPCLRMMSLPTILSTLNLPLVKY